MKYILVGGSGFIGQHFYRKLKDKIILNLDINSGINNTDFKYCNIINFDELQRIDISEFQMVTLIHLSAVHFDFQKNYYETNVNGTENILKFINSNKNIVRYVFFSSVATYGNSKNGKNENSNQFPINDYGKSKLIAEKTILNWHKKNSKIKTIIIRPAVVFGEYNFGNVYNLINQVKSGLFAIIGNGKNIKSIAYAGNIVDSVIFSLKNVNNSLFIYNYCDYPNSTIEQQIISILSVLKKRKIIFKIPLFLTLFFTKIIDILELLIKKDLKINSMRVKKFTVPTNFSSDLIRETGFKQKISLNESLNNTINWIEKNNVKLLRKKWYKIASKL